MDEATPILTAEWLAKADEDYRAAQTLLAAGIRTPALFHCQQAAEKALKAYLCFHRQPLEKTHDITRLIEVAASIDTEWEKLLPSGVILSPLAVEFRYPGAGDLPDDHAALAATREILLATRQKLPVNLFPKAWPND
ncbi:MAG: HEPN domain-containing protein [Pseudomonadota bacterium]